MLDLNVLIKKQNEGNQILTTLGENEEYIMQNYALLATMKLLETGVQAKFDITKIILNAFRNGICLGLVLEISEGEVKERSK